MGSSTNSEKNERKYGDKELERMHGLDTYDFLARAYDPVVGRFNSIDPLCEKYYSISPYAYCANNPVKYVDPDGRKLILANGSSDTFKGQVAMAVQNLNENKNGGILKNIHDSPGNIFLKESKKETYFDKTESTIYWNPTEMILTDTGYEMTATEVLNHEGDHALQSLTNPDQMKKDAVIDEQNPYKTKEEERVITGSEQRTARNMGKLNDGEVTRTNHGGTRHPTTSPITTNNLNEQIIKPQ